MTVSGETLTVTGGGLCTLTGITTTQIHNWCNAGVFGPDQLDHPGSGRPRQFGPVDILVAKACRRAAQAFEQVNGRGGAPMSVLRSVADQVRSGVDVARVRLFDGVELSVDVVDLRAAP